MPELGIAEILRVAEFPAQTVASLASIFTLQIGGGAFTTPAAT